MKVSFAKKGKPTVKDVEGLVPKARCKSGRTLTLDRFDNPYAWIDVLQTALDSNANDIWLSFENAVVVIDRKEAKAMLKQVLREP